MGGEQNVGNVMKSYEDLSEERKRGIKDGNIPEWYETIGYQLFKDRYQDNQETVKECMWRMAKGAAEYTSSPNLYRKEFFKMLWKGWYSPSTPQYNIGTNRGLPVACSGGLVADSVEGFADSFKEAMLLTQEGFGTSNYLGDIRCRGSKTSRGFKVDGVAGVIENFRRLVDSVSQGNKRRGAWAGYLPITHGDFKEVVNTLHRDKFNFGWCLDNQFLEDLNKPGQEDLKIRMSQAMRTRSNKGRGYLLMTDKCNDLQSPVYKSKGLKTVASNLCTEITLTQDENHTFTCVLGSINLMKWDEIKKNLDETIETMLIFLDATINMFLDKAPDYLWRAVNFTKKSRAVGLGQMGFHSYLQSKDIVFGSVESTLINAEVNNSIREACSKANLKLGRELGSPEWCEDHKVRFSHTTAIAPNTSSSMLMGGCSPGIEPYYGGVFTENSAGGQILRITPKTKQVLEKYGKYNKKTIEFIAKEKGSVQKLDFLTQEEKLVLRTAFEINQKDILKLANQRGKLLGDYHQAQSLNLFFPAKENPKVVTDTINEALYSPYIKSLYYQRTQAGISGSTGECIACEG